MIFEDIVAQIESNGGVITKVDVQDDFAEIDYTDANGNAVVKRYKIVINDDDSEDWSEVK